MGQPRRLHPPDGGRFGPIANLAIFAFLPLVLLGGLLAALIATGVLSLKPASDGKGALEALLLGPVGVTITGKDRVELRSADGLVMVAIPAGSVSSLITLYYRESSPSDAPRLPAGYISTGRFFDLSARPVDANNGPARFRQTLTITMKIGQGDLALAGTDYSRFFIQHYDTATQSWDVLTTTADLLASTV